MNNIINISGYLFISLANLPSLREKLRQQATEFALKGTILLAEEGINIMLAGTIADVEQFIQQLKQDNRFAPMEFKNTYSDFIPFKRLLVKIKKEIITFAVPSVDPQQTAPNLSPEQLKQWLDEKKPLTIVDVRNRCEIEAGKFVDAIELNIDHFRDFPKAVKQLPNVDQPIVMYCTGGIRCEKAAAYVMQQGAKEVYQLQGGILNYFAQCGEAHYQGKCFVFDERGVVGAGDFQKK